MEHLIDRKEERRNRTDKIYIKHCFGFIDINIYIRIWRVLRVFSFFAPIYRFQFVWHFVLRLVKNDE